MPSGFTLSEMASSFLSQGDVTAGLSEIFYKPAEGFQEGNTWYVAEESISAESDRELTDGPATLHYTGKQFPVTVSVLEFEAEPGDEDAEIEGAEPACIVEIDFDEGLPKLARALGLADDPSARRQRR